jgi:hypothetical protein
MRGEKTLTEQSNDFTFSIRHYMKTEEFKVTCPGCKTTMGHKGGKDGKLIHLDVLWSSESGLYVECDHSEILLQNVEKMDENYNPTFKEPFASLLRSERDRHESGQQTPQDFKGTDKGLYIAMRQYAMYYFEEPDGKSISQDFNINSISEDETRTFKELFEASLV